MNKINKKKGFTLIEILVVIGIIAILATVVLIAINPARQFSQARDTQRFSNVNAILNAIGQYTADHKGVLPPDIPVSPTAPADITAGLCTALVPTYIPALPSDPKSADYSGASLLAADCAGLDTKDIGYTVQQDTTANGGRIKVAAVGEITTAISVTR
jgi:prepilin-type N-terminal cleavage/methylation domain-containing protein